MAAVLPDACHHSDDALVSHTQEEMHDMQEAHEHMHAQDLAGTASHSHDQQASFSEADPYGLHASSPDNSCKHCAPCCMGVAVLPALAGFNPPVLAQSTRPWTAPALLSIAPRLFERPPKRFAV